MLQKFLYIYIRNSVTISKEEVIAIYVLLNPIYSTSCICFITCFCESDVPVICIMAVIFFFSLLYIQCKVRCHRLMLQEVILNHMRSEEHTSELQSHVN